MIPPGNIGNKVSRALLVDRINLPLRPARPATDIQGTKRARATMDRTKMQNDELTDADVLRVDPVHEYERRYHMREVSESILSRVGDDSDPRVAQGRPTGP